MSKNWAIYEDVINKWEEGQNHMVFPGGESLHDVETRFSALLTDLAGKKNVLLVGHCLLFVCVIWLFADNSGSTLENNHMERGHLSLLIKKGRGFRLHDFNRPPPEAVAV